MLRLTDFWKSYIVNISHIDIYRHSNELPGIAPHVDSELVLQGTPPDCVSRVPMLCCENFIYIQHFSY